MSKGIVGPKLWPIAPKRTGRPRGRPKEEAVMRQVAFLVDTKLKDTLEKLAYAEGISLSEYCRNVFKKVSDENTM